MSWLIKINYLPVFKIIPSNQYNGMSLQFNYYKNKLNLKYFFTINLFRFKTVLIENDTGLQFFVIRYGIGKYTFAFYGMR